MPILLLNVVQLALVAAVVVGLGVLAHLRGHVPHGAWTAITSIALGGFLIGVAWVGRRPLRRYRDAYGRRYALEVGAALAAATGGVAVWRGAVHGEPIRALADTLVVSVAYPFRLLWMIVGAVAVAFLSLVVPLLRGGEEARRRATTALLGLTLGPLGFAVGVACATAALGAAARPFSGAGDWASGTPWCLSGPAGWSPGRSACGAAGIDATNPWAWGQALFADALAPLLVVGSAGLLLAGLAGALAVRLARAARPGTPRHAQAAAARHLTGVLDAPAARALLAGAIAVSGLALVLAWSVPGLSRAGLAYGTGYVAAGLGLLVSAVLAASRALGLTSRGLLTGRGTATETARVMLDRAYDVATWLREPAHLWRSAARGGAGPGPRLPRREILARGAALAAHVNRPRDGGAYARNVFLAHSQGTVIATALLREDGVELPAEVALVTIGSPHARLDARRLPDQFGWVETLPAGAGAALPRVTLEWANHAAARDPIGGPILHQPTDADWDALATWRRPGRPALREGLVDGGHCAYGDSPAVLRTLAELASAPARRPDARDVRGFWHHRRREAGPWIFASCNVP